MPVRHCPDERTITALSALPASNDDNDTPPLPYLPAPNARSSECAANSSVLVVVDVCEVKIIMDAGMDSLIVDVVEMNVILGFAVNNSNLAVVEVFIRML